jgi:hypothetical protein
MAAKEFSLKLLKYYKKPKQTKLNTTSAKWATYKNLEHAANKFCGIEPRRDADPKQFQVHPAKQIKIHKLTAESNLFAKLDNEVKQPNLNVSN